MVARRERMSRVLPRRTPRAARIPECIDAPRRVRRTVIDFSALPLPPDVRVALADAFWNHFGVRSPQQIMTLWAHIKVFVRFVVESAPLHSLADVHRGLLVRFIEWLNIQRRANGEPWSKAGRAGPYMTLRSLLQWLARCRSGVLGELHFPFNPFPWRNRDSGRVRRLPARDLRAILKACERDITALRALRDRGERERAEAGSSDPVRSLGALLEAIDQRYGGIVPPHKILSGAGHHPVVRGLKRYGGIKQVEPYLYPRSESLLPYYLAILIHTAGNPQPIAELSCDCLQPIPLLDDRQMLVWTKRRAGTSHRRSFRNTTAFEPPALVQEIIEWTRRLRPHAPRSARNRLLLFKGMRGVNVLSTAFAKMLVRSDFRPRHGLPHFSLASIRPSVLSAFYRASGDLQEVKAVANHQQLATTVRYVEGPEVEAQHRVRIAALQHAFLGHISRPHSAVEPVDRAAAQAPPPSRPAAPREPAVSMFGFDCTDPLAGIAPGTRSGELCTNFLGCFTCPNAIITADAPSVARLLQARDHLRAAAAQIHPARWEAIYAPLLRILEEDILTRFAASELAGATPHQALLPPLPELR
jgi:hypothetical protein